MVHVPGRDFRLARQPILTSHHRGLNLGRRWVLVPRPPRPVPRMDFCTRSPQPPSLSSWFTKVPLHCFLNKNVCYLVETGFLHTANNKDTTRKNNGGLIENELRSATLASSSPLPATDALPIPSASASTTAATAIATVPRETPPELFLRNPRSRGHGARDPRRGPRGRLPSEQGRVVPCAHRQAARRVSRVGERAGPSPAVAGETTKHGVRGSN